jgi:hypothetical protein
LRHGRSGTEGFRRPGFGGTAADDVVIQWPARSADSVAKHMGLSWAYRAKNRPSWRDDRADLVSSGRAGPPFKSKSRLEASRSGKAPSGASGKGRREGIVNAAACCWIPTDDPMTFPNRLNCVGRLIQI